jgi:restriction system protein
VALPLADSERFYKAVIAQVAVRTVREVFEATPDDMVSAVLFNGHVDTVDPATGGKIRPPLISMRATRGLQPTHVRDLYGTMQHEGATLGIMITTSGYGPGSVEFANGKPLHLIDGPGLIAICQEQEIPARILGIGTRKPRH